MWNSTVVIPFLFLCLVNFSVSSPVPHSLNEGRGIGSTLWGWITYPFSWWSYGESDDISQYNQLGASSTNEPVESIEIGKRNVTVWCNDQTCTTMRCDIFGCTNLTCNIYDTDLNGECRIFNTIHLDEPTSKPIDTQTKPIQTASKPIESTSKPVEALPKPIESSFKPVQPPLKPIEFPIKPDDGGKITESTDKVVEISTNKSTVSTQNNSDQAFEERPIELEMMLSAKVTQDNDKKSPKEA